MKKTIAAFIFIIIALISSCNSNNSANTPVSGNTTSNLKILKWGPDEPLKLGTIPNKQPDGKMGLWIDVSSTEGLGDVQVLFAGKPEPTAVQPKLITAGISPEEISAAGDKKIEIKLLSSGQTIPVGTLKIIP